MKHPNTCKHNWRGVTLLSIGSKLIARIVANRIQTFSESFMDEQQQGFRRNRGVDDVLQVSRRLTEEIVSSRGPQNVHITLYDIEKAYPRINRDALWQLLQRRGVPPEFINVCKGLHNFTQFHTRVERVTSRDYEADRGLKEGCPSSPPLFNLYHQAVLADFRIRRKRAADRLGLTAGVEWKIFVDGRLKRRRASYSATTNSKTHIFDDLEFADDTATISTEEEKPHADRILERTFQDWGEKLNRNKTETLVLKPGTPPAQRNAPPQEHPSVRHVGGIICSTGAQWKDTIHRCNQAKRRAREIAKAWSTGTHRGRGVTSRVKLLARLRVMRSVIAPTLTTFGRSRTWTRGQVALLQSAQNYALQRAFGLDRLAMHEYHITNDQLHRAAMWPTIKHTLMSQTLKWLGHICRMPIDRLPKLALFGTWVHNTRSPTKAQTQTYWISEVLKEADIHHLDFFRLAQNKDPTRWNALIQKAFPHHTIPRAGKPLLNNWRIGQPLPNFTSTRRRTTRTVWTPPAHTVPPNSCPVCRQNFPRLRDLHLHYLHEHAVTDPAITTFNLFQCGECRQTFPNAYARVNHECRVLFEVPEAQSRDKFGWLPLDIPSINPHPDGWKIYTDGSFDPHHPATAGWGFAVYDAADHDDSQSLFEIFGPVTLDPQDQRF